ncbi:transducin-like enhancer protein 6 [Choloepus didactylus]|uniref:transducin-like enhancer protein 6 n=1 Tax=Choloepus didactylus TaxID=27675 RepID=UPI00189D3F99|nr:transducin-like enhancer protein 6 [Choloepus didactylus]
MEGLTEEVNSEQTAAEDRPIGGRDRGPRGQAASRLAGASCGRLRILSPRAAAAHSLTGFAVQSLKMTSQSPPSSQGHSHGVENAEPPGNLVESLSSDSKAPRELTSLNTLDEFKVHFSRFPPKLMAQVKNIYHLLQKVQEDLQEHNRQAKDFLQLIEIWDQPQDVQPTKLQVSQVSSGKPASQESRKPARSEPSQQAEVQFPQPCSLQRPDFEDVADTRLSTWSQGPSQGDVVAFHRPQIWDTQEPQFWQDLLTRRLWQIFSGPSLPTSSSSNSEGSREGRTSLDTAAEGVPSHVAQEPVETACQFLKPVSWDPEDFEDTWNRPGSFPWRSKKLAVPYKLEKMRTLKHGKPVLSTAISSFTHHVFTCSRGGIKVWSLSGQVAKDRFPESYLPVQTPGAYLYTCLLFPDSTTLLAGGSSLAGVSVWDLAASRLHVKAELPCQGLTCQALAASPSDNLAFAGFTDGTVRIWDLRKQGLVRQLPRHPNGTRNVAVRGHNVWTGGLDACLRCWDLKMVGEPREVRFESQIMSLDPSPREDWVLLGLANGQQWLQHPSQDQRHLVGCDRRIIFDLKFSPYGQWWVSVGLDDLVGIHGMPTGRQVFQVPETSSIYCCDVASNNRLIVTGSTSSASVYQITY